MVSAAWADIRAAGMIERTAPTAAAPTRRTKIRPASRNAAIDTLRPCTTPQEHTGKTVTCSTVELKLVNEVQTNCAAPGIPGLNRTVRPSETVQLTKP
jgi:hypothetical protein